MKMRKKLAALLAAAMIAGVMPMTAFAASTNRVTNIVTAKTETELKTNAPVVKIELKDTLATNVAFYLNLTGSEWLDPLLSNTAVVDNSALSSTPNATVGISRINGTTLRVQASTPVSAKAIIEIPLNVKLTGGEATVEVESAGTVVDTSTHIFANASNDAASKLVVDDAKNFADKNGMVSKITIKEPFKGAYAGTSIAERTFRIELRDTDFYFAPITTGVAGDRTQLVGTKGFYPITVSGANVLTAEPRISGVIDYSAYNTGAVVVTADEIIVVLPATAAAQPGEFELKNIAVNAKKGATKGDVSVVARGDLIDGPQEFVVAKYSDFTTKLEMKKEYKASAGRAVDVEFTLSEEVADSLLANRSLDISLSKGAKFDVTKTIKVTPDEKNTNNTKTGATAVQTVMNTDNFESFEVSNLLLNATKKAKYTFEATILVPNNFEGEEIILTAEGRALPEKHEIVLTKVNKLVEVDVTPMDIKVGLQGQVGGKIVIKENEKEAILRSWKSNLPATSGNDAEIVISIDNSYGELKITAADIEVTEGDLVLDLDAKVVSAGSIVIPVKRQSTKPSTIEITNIEVTANRAVPEGTFDVKIGGNALSQNTYAQEFTRDKAFKDDVPVKYLSGTTHGRFNDSVIATKFINITTKNTEDGAGRTGAEVVSFVIGNSKFIADGVEVEMDAAPYIKDGRTMVPLRYLATALGVDSESIKFNAGVVTIFKADGKVIQVTVGNKNLVVNGMTIPMVAAAEIVEGRTYVPVTEIGGIFGVAGTWDAATQTATFQ